MIENAEPAKGESLSQKIHNFFEHPKSLISVLVQLFIIILILASLAIIIIEVFYPSVFNQYLLLFEICEYIIVALFTVEYLLRLLTAPEKLKWVFRPLNIVDFLAIFPNYLEFILNLFFPTTALRALRIIRIVRFIRVLRVFKLIKYKSIFSYKQTIFQQITPIIVFFLAVKVVFWYLEFKQIIRISEPEGLAVLFTIIGFALGIILSAKISVAYDKFVNVDETVVRLAGKMNALTNIMQENVEKPDTRVCYEWSKCFLMLLHDKDADNSLLYPKNQQLYKEMKKLEPGPAEMATLYMEFTSEASYCLSKKIRLTPKAYDVLLHQATIFYFILLVILLPGIIGLISVGIAIYVLYGMYFLSRDLDSILGGDYNLIDINTKELQGFIDNFEAENPALPSDSHPTEPPENPAEY